jgi:hypothetical protein
MRNRLSVRDRLPVHIGSIAPIISFAFIAGWPLTR